ncbi:4Fe-4S binding protein [Geothrix sp. 21YS21S-2]|uniref:4Fe-4S binding protein n=1 Tax=Geothrix sp. 21YS21S-2 TaxID=3068893 RepID=UPI0027B96F23|nr:4Fe-4S binding protein [Geothrix sp. 21YS21S-2]
MSARRHHARRGVQILVLVAGTLVPWTGFFRIDAPGVRVVYLGTSYPLEWPYVLGMIIPFLVGVWALALLSFLKGRVFCGWACPYGSLVEFFEGLRTAAGWGSNRLVAAWMRRSPLHRLGLRAGALLTLAIAPLLLGASLAAYLYPPARILRELGSPLDLRNHGQVVLWAWMALVLVSSWLAGFLVRFHFCRMVCIYGMGQAMAASAADPAKVLRPRYRPEDLGACGSCQACLKACFVEVDPRDRELQLGFSAGCFNCGDCVDVCETVQGHKGRPSLLTFERPAAPRETPRVEESGDSW